MIADSHCHIISYRFLFFIALENVKSINCVSLTVNA